MASLRDYVTHKATCKVSQCQTCDLPINVGQHFDDHYGAKPHKFEPRVCSCGLADALRSAEWQPIETAPKDGAHFLAWLGKYPVLAFMHDGHVEMEYSGGVYLQNATHWQPLPDPPVVIPHEDGTR